MIFFVNNNKAYVTLIDLLLLVLAQGRQGLRRTQQSRPLVRSQFFIRAGLFDLPETDIWIFI